MMGNKITNVGIPTEDSDAATKGYVDSATGTDTLALLGCAADQVAKYNGTSWNCSNDIDTDTNSDVLASIGCSINQIVQYNGTDWECIDLGDPPGSAYLTGQLLLADPNGLDTKTSTVILLVQNEGADSIFNVSPTNDCSAMTIPPASGSFSPCSLDGPDPVFELRPGSTAVFKWDGTVNGGIDEIFTFCNGGTGFEADLVTPVIPSGMSCDDLTVIDPTDCGGCGTLGTFTNYYLSFADIQEDDEILCNTGDIALSVLGVANSNIDIIPLKSDNQTAVSGDPVVGFGFSGVSLEDVGIVCLDLTP